ncbi:MAG: MarR family winged helix-turn-helix transcriptional regulator [Verrucomicrobium sp.]
MMIPRLPEDADREPLPESLTRYTGFLVAKAHQRLWTLFGDECKRLGMDVHGCGVLHLLEEFGPMSQQQLGRKLRIDRTSMVKMVDALEEKDLACRKDHPEDRRIYLVEITTAGRKSLEDIKTLAHVMEQRLLEPFTESEIKVIRRALLTLAG